MADDAPNMEDEVAARQWVEANPGRVSEMLEERSCPDSECTVFSAALHHLKSLPSTVRLLDEKGADVNAFYFCSNELIPLRMAGSLEIVIALMDRGADPTRLDDANWTPVLHFTLECELKVVDYLLQDARVRALVNLQDSPQGNTTLHFACVVPEEAKAIRLGPPSP